MGQLRKGNPLNYTPPIFVDIAVTPDYSKLSEKNRPKCININCDNPAMAKYGIRLKKHGVSLKKWHIRCSNCHNARHNLNNCKYKEGVVEVGQMSCANYDGELLDGFPCLLAFAIKGGYPSVKIRRHFFDIDHWDGNHMNTAEENINN